jgi:hypothetical protein
LSKLNTLDISKNYDLVKEDDEEEDVVTTLKNILPKVEVIYNL